MRRAKPTRSGFLSLGAFFQPLASEPCKPCATVPYIHICRVFKQDSPRLHDWEHPFRKTVCSSYLSGFTRRIGYDKICFHTRYTYYPACGEADLLERTPFKFIPESGREHRQPLARGLYSPLPGLNLTQGTDFEMQRAFGVSYTRRTANCQGKHTPTLSALSSMLSDISTDHMAS